MSDLVYGPAAVERARTAMAAEARRLPALGDHLPTLPGTALGDLDGADALLAAVTALTTALEGELAAGGRHLDAADRALDATLGATRTTDATAARSLRPHG